MKSNNRIIKKALQSLTDTEKEILSLLTQSDTTREKVLDFLGRYDIDNETTATSFLINKLLDRFELSESDNPGIPRIRGLMSFFRFHNATAIMKRADNGVVTDIDLLLKLRFPDEIRPFTAMDRFIDTNTFRMLMGKRYTNKVLDNPVHLKIQNKEFIIPNDNFLRDVVFCGIYFLNREKSSDGRMICYIYDVYRYCPDEKPSLELTLTIIRKEIRHTLGRIKRWLLR